MNRKTTLRSVGVFILSFLILSLAASGIMYQYIKQKKNQYFYVASNQSNIIMDSVDSALSRAYTMKALTVSYNGDTDFFDNVSELIYNEVKETTGISLKNIALAPNGIVKKVYPVRGNESLIGFNFMDNSKPGNEEAIEAYLKGDMIITNPFSLIQGGTGMAGRLPVFITTEEKRQPEFWGLVTVTIDFDELMQAIDMDALKRMKSDYCLWYMGENNTKVVLSQSENIGKYPSRYQFKIKNLTWYLDITPDKGWISPVLKLVVLITITGFSILLSMLVQSDSKVREANDKLQNLANIDPLSACYSRNYLNTTLINIADGSWRNADYKYSVVILDIDSFKNVNDNFGHGVGDLAIRRVADIILSNIKPEDGDSVIRFGGDEFVILFNDITPKRLEEKLNSIKAGVNNLVFPNYPELQLTVSMGAEPYNEEKPLSYHEQVKKADEKLYISKNKGKNCYTL